MCWMCDQDRSIVSNSYWADKLGLSPAHVAAASAGKSVAGIIQDGIGDGKTAPFGDGLLLITADDVPDTIQTTKTLTLNGPSIISTIDTIGDQDFFKVELVAGKSYEIGDYAYIGGPGGIPLADTYLEIYDAAGNLVVSADGGASTAYNTANSGFDVLLTFTPQISGTYYINARAFDNAAEDGITTGDSVGDYELFIRDAAADAYKPYYDVDSPLYSLDWGSQVDGTVRNPDGAESGHTTGNAAGTADTKGASVG